MSQPRFLTPKQYREQLLKNTLMSGVIASKPFYVDKMFRPVSMLTEDKKQQRDFYNNIDELGFRISSRQYAGPPGPRPDDPQERKVWDKEMKESESQS